MSDLDHAHQGFDVAGAARDHQARTRRWSPILMGQPDVAACYGLIARNPSIAAAVLQSIHRELAQLPGGGVGLDVPLSFGRHNGVA